jgi:hypothetical protein
MPDQLGSNSSLRLPADCTIAAIRGVYDLIREANFNSTIQTARGAWLCVLAGANTRK